MKKKLVATLVAAMVLSVGTTVFAAPSPTTPTVAPTVYFNECSGEVTAIPQVDGTAITVQKSVPTELVTAKAENRMKTVDEENKAYGVEQKREIVTVIDLTPSVAPTEANPVKLVIPFNVKAGANYEVWHCDETDAANPLWENNSVKVLGVTATGIVAEFTSLSPVAVVEVETKPLTTTGKTAEELAWEQYWANWIWNNMQAGNNTTTEAATSPKTVDVTGGLLVLTALCGAGTVVLAKKTKND